MEKNSYICSICNKETDSIEVCWICGRKICFNCVGEFDFSSAISKDLCSTCKKLKDKYMNVIKEKELELCRFINEQYRLWKAESLNLS